ncbi:uncharacterized protein LOC134809106 isoform X2 [Pan troglodytes]|uniref:uncharacterized protein LOC134809106 isoform X2 n=1 Tax=Pan troglodytes TaxID=9598 RepID=UPI003014130F
MEIEQCHWRGGYLPTMSPRRHEATDCSARGQRSCGDGSVIASFKCTPRCVCVSSDAAPHGPLDPPGIRDPCCSLAEFSSPSYLKHVFQSPAPPKLGIW